MRSYNLPNLQASMMKLGCYLFMAIVGLIGFMNMANTMIMNITTKKQEYGVLQAVGMTNKQLNLCLQLQGLMFTVGTICVALIIGLPLGYALFSYAKHNGIFGMNIYHVPIVPIFIMIFLVGLLQIVLSCVLSSNLKKETLVRKNKVSGIAKAGIRADMWKYSMCLLFSCPKDNNKYQAKLASDGLTISIKGSSPLS